MDLPVFTYDARNQSGKKISGQIKATTKQGALSQLRRQELQVWHLEEMKDPVLEPNTSLLNRQLSWQRKLNNRKLSMILHQLSSLLRAGIPLDRSLALLARVPREKIVKEFLLHGYNQVRTGKSLSFAWTNEYLGFPSYGESMLQAGESSGELEVVLDQIAKVVDENDELRQLLKTSLSYPLFLLSVSIAVVIGLLVYAVPQFEMIFGMWGGDLPIATRLLVDFSELVRVYGSVLGAVIIGLIVLVLVGSTTSQGRYILDSVLLRIPVIGPAVRDLSSARLFNTISVMLTGGVTLTDALMLAADAGGNSRLAKAIINSAWAVSNGGDLAMSLKKEQVFPETVVELVALGSETGEMALVMQQSAGILADETSRRVKSLSTLLEPIMILFMALVVGFIVIAILVPIITIMDVPL